jgi:hypothetical protein
MAVRNVITGQAVGRMIGHNVDDGVARLAKHQALRTQFPLQNLIISQIRTFEAFLSAKTLRASRISCREARLGNWQGAGPTAQQSTRVLQTLRLLLPNQ